MGTLEFVIFGHFRFRYGNSGFSSYTDLLSDNSPPIKNVSKHK